MTSLLRRRFVTLTKQEAKQLKDHGVVALRSPASLHRWDRLHIDACLWVQEPYALAGVFNQTPSDGWQPDWADHQVAQGLIWYQADGNAPSAGTTVADQLAGPGCWREAKTMPRWASRWEVMVADIATGNREDLTITLQLPRSSEQNQPIPPRRI